MTARVLVSNQCSCDGIGRHQGLRTVGSPTIGQKAKNLVTVKHLHEHRKLSYCSWAFGCTRHLSNSFPRASSHDKNERKREAHGLGAPILSQRDGVACRSLQSAGYPQLLTASRQELDLRDGPAVERWFAEHQPTVVVLAAAMVGGIQSDATYPGDFLLENLKIQTNVIETAWRWRVRRLLFLGSSCIYPKFAEQPIREEALLTGPLEPTNEWYAIAKITCIKLCQALRLQHGFDAISLLPKPSAK